MPLRKTMETSHFIRAQELTEPDAPPSSDYMNASHSLRQLASRRKGLSNGWGNNNCFLNVILQSLWHLRSCRTLITSGDHALHHLNERKKHTDKPCLLCELEQLFVLYQFAEEPVLDVESVRLALSDVFDLGDMNDATEALEAILDALHADTFDRMQYLRMKDQTQDTDMANGQAEDIVCEPQCLAHLLFQMNLMELSVCIHCGNTGEPLMNTDFLYRVYAQEILSIASELQEKDGDVTWERILQTEAQGLSTINGAMTTTCERCEEKKMQRGKWILTLPMVFAVSVIWSSDMVNKREITHLMDLLTTQTNGVKKEDKQQLDLRKVFRVHEDERETQQSVFPDYTFRGLVCYYGRHYVGFFASHDENGGEEWFLFDDTRVKKIGEWSQVRLRVERGGYQPTLLFYERNDIRKSELERTARDIHTWWQESSETKEMEDLEDPGVLVEPPKVLSNEKKKVPTSPIATDTNEWQEQESIYSMMHEKAQDTLSKLNGILFRTEDSNDTSSFDYLQASVDMRRTMSQSMRKKSSKREYSFHRKQVEELDPIDTDEIFQDVVDTNLKDEEAYHKPIGSTDTSMMQSMRVIAKQHDPIETFDVELDVSDGGLGLVLEDESVQVKGKDVRKIVVHGFEPNGAGKKLPAEASGRIQVGDWVASVNGKIVNQSSTVDVMEMLVTSETMVRLGIERRYPWACPACTLVNAADKMVCEACEHARALEVSF